MLANKLVFYSGLGLKCRFPLFELFEERVFRFDYLSPGVPGPIRVGESARLDLGSPIMPLISVLKVYKLLLL